MYNYNITATTENEKYNIINLIRRVGSGYYIQLNATPLQASAINMELSKGGKN